jgi:protein-glutamine gamma-glutamyltransferase
MSAQRQTTDSPSTLTIGRYFDVSLFFLVLIGFGTLASTGALELATVLLVGAAFLVRGYLLATRRTFLIPLRWTNYLTLIYVVFYLADYFLLSGSFIAALVHLVLFLMVVRLFSTQRERDHYMLAVLAFVMVLAAAVLTVDGIFLVFYAVFLLTAVVTFVLMEMRHSSAVATVHSRESGHPQEQRRLAWSLSAAAPLLGMLILAGGTVVFFILPRVSAHFLTTYALTNDFSTGFSDRVELGRIGQIQQSRTVVMHVRLDEGARAPGDLKLRGVALNLFHGKSWANSLEQRPALRAADGSILPISAEMHRRNVSDLLRILTPHRSIHYRVVMEPIGTNVFFLASQPEKLHGNYFKVNTDAAGALYDLDSAPIGVYDANSNIAQVTAEKLRQSDGDYPPDILLEDLQLPKIDARIPQLAEQVTASADNNYDKAVAIEHYLSSHFGYTLELPRISPADPLAHFLFERKRGHCEYFSSAMAVMLRTLRIPSRVVNGFRGGEFNDLTSNYVVRASDAHSWVEAYFPGSGWVSFDPTPAGPAQVHAGWSRMLLYVDAMSSFWREWVIDYDSTHQRILGQGAMRSSRALLENLRLWAQNRYFSLLESARHVQGRMSQSPHRWTMAAIGITLLLLLITNGRQLWRAFRKHQLRNHPEREPHAAASIWYERTLHFLARRGWRKLPVQTPTEFARQIEDASLRHAVAQFTRHYESARFGDSADAASMLPQLYEEITAAGIEQSSKR